MRILLAILLALSLPAQTIRVANHSELPSPGWTRCTVDRLPPVPIGRVGDAEFVVGRQVGRDVWAIDVRVPLQPGEQRTIVLDKAEAARIAIPGIPDVFAHFGWPLTVGGVPLELTAVSLDAMAWTARLHARVGPLLHVDVWIQWRGDEPGIVRGECVACASNPSNPDVLCDTSDASFAFSAATAGTGARSLSATAADAGEKSGGSKPAAVTGGTGAGSSDGIRLAWGDALVHVLGAGWGAPVLAGAIATGQARSVPFTMVWTRHLRTTADWLAAIAAVNGTTCAVGIEKLLVDGNPTHPAGFDARAWTSARYPEALRRLHTWEVAVCGPNKASGDTGAQEDQVFVRGEALLDGGVGAERVAYLSALKLAARPCHHLQPNGDFVDPTTAEPRLIYWDGMPHWSVGVSPNRLGKPRNPTPAETNGWVGPDVEHWLYNTLFAAARFTGSHALQWELRCQAMLYLGQWTTTPGWSTTQPYAARAVGWEGIAAVHLWEDLEDRALAERVRAHWLRRANEVILPAWRDRDVVDVRRDDPRLGAGDWWMPWQQSVGAYGLDLACAVLGPAEGRDVALRLARTVVRDAFRLVGDRWQTQPVRPVAGDTGSDESFNAFGMPLAVATVLRHDPDDERARSIWAQIPRGSWTAPGIVTP